MLWISQTGSVFNLKLVLRIVWFAKWAMSTVAKSRESGRVVKLLPRWKRVIVASS